MIAILIFLLFFSLVFVPAKHIKNYIALSNFILLCLFFIFWVEKYWVLSGAILLNIILLSMIYWQKKKFGYLRKVRREEKIACDQAKELSTKADKEYRKIVSNHIRLKEFNIVSLSQLLNDYFAPLLREKKMRVEVCAAQSSYLSYMKIEDIYRLIFGVSYHLLKICLPTYKLLIILSSTNSRMKIEFKLFNTSIFITAVEKYMPTLGPSRQSLLANWAEIHEICALYGYSFQVNDNSILIE